MVYVDPCSVVDATGEGVHARNTQRMFFPEKCATHVLRLQEPLSKDEREAVCTYVRGRVGTEYSVKEAAATWFGGRDNWSSKQFCSRLVAQAFASIGRFLVADPDFCSPEELRQSPLLAAVSAATEQIAARDVERWRNDRDMTQVTRDVTNTLLNGIRKKNKDIQDLNDVDTHLIAHPEDDAYYADLLEKTGYLTMWRAEMRKNPWQYDVEALKATGWPDEQIESYCHLVLETADNGGKRYHNNKAGYLYLLNEHGLRSFQLLSSLYQTLCDLDMQRFQVAKQARGLR